MPRPFWPVLVAGLALALAMVLSPVAVAMAAAMGAAIAIACHDLRGRERTLVLVMLALAIALRVAAIAALFAWSDPAQRTEVSFRVFPFDGDGWIMKHRALWIRNIWLGVPVDPQDFSAAFEPYGWSSYIFVIAYLQYLCGPAPYAIHLFNVVCFAAGALLLHRIVRATYGSVAGSMTLAFTLFWPTLFLWSISALKDSLYFLLMAAVVFGVWTVACGRGAMPRLAGFALACGCAWALHSVRAGALVIVLAALAVTLLGTFVTRRFYLAALVSLVVLVAGGRMLDSPGVQGTVLPRLRQSAALHFGHVTTPGHAYKLLDTRFYSGRPVVKTMTWPEAERFVLRSLWSFVAFPLPWQALSLSELLVLPQQMLWYCLVILAVLGAIEGAKGDVWVTWLLIGMCIAGAAVVAPHEGNIGTLVRHRDSIVPFTAALGSVGLAWALSRAVGIRRRSRRREAVRPDGWVRRRTGSRVAIQALSTVIAGSTLCSIVAVLFRRTDASVDGLTARSESELRAALMRVANQSVVAPTLSRGVRVVQSARRGSAVVAVLEALRGFERVERIRLAGWVLLIGTSTAGVVGWLGDAARPEAFVWAATMVVAVVLITGSTPRVGHT